MIETVPLQEAAAAYAKMMAGKARFRIVLVMNNGASEVRLGSERSKVAV
jgi:propanol-preferring alcohol dehydrogenase